MKPEQESKVAALCTLLRAYEELPFVRYEWDELVEKLCSSEDPELRETGIRELEKIKLKDPAFKINLRG